MDVHIIPESFFRSIGSPNKGIRLVSVSGKVRPRRSPIGVYDEAMLCDGCERNFQVGDDYANTVLLTDQLRREAIRRGKEALGYFIHGIDYAKFKLFFLSVLWRAHHCTHDFFSSIDIGPHFDKLDRMVKAGDPGNPNEFAVCLFEYRFPYSALMHKPYRTRFEGLNFCAISMGKYMAMIKVDKRPFSASLLRLQPGQPFGVSYKDFVGSPLEPLFWQAIKNNPPPKRKRGAGS